MIPIRQHTELSSIEGLQCVQRERETGHTLYIETGHPLQLTAGSLSWSPAHTVSVSYLLPGKLFSAHLCSALIVHSTNKKLNRTP